MTYSNEMEKRLKNLREMRDVQGRIGNWNYDQYMLGMYNALELAVATMEDREPVYKSQADYGKIKEQDQLKGLKVSSVSYEEENPLFRKEYLGTWDSKVNPT